MHMRLAGFLILSDPIPRAYASVCAGLLLPAPHTCHLPDCGFEVCQFLAARQHQVHTWQQRWTLRGLAVTFLHEHKRSTVTPPPA